MSHNPTVPLTRLLGQMTRMRAFEEAIGELWARGLASGEMHLGVGEEGIVAGVLDHLAEGDALALDYRPTPALVGAGSDLGALTLEVLGHPGGLCGGMGGHMHLFDPERLAASSGIVGAPAPYACGFALAQQRRGSGGITVAFFGDGALNQGMVMESINLAVAWRLPVLFVCKDNKWAVTTRTARLSGGTIAGRARSFGLPVRVVDGTSVGEVWRAAAPLVAAARRGKGPAFIVASCRRPRGHFEDDPLFRTSGALKELARESRALLGAVFERGGAPLRHRLAALAGIGRTVGQVAAERRARRRDPLRRAAGRLPAAEAEPLMDAARRQVRAAVAAAVSGTETPS